MVREPSDEEQSEEDDSGEAQSNRQQPNARRGAEGHHVDDGRENNLSV